MNGSIRKRGDGWELTIDLGRDASGKRKRKFVNVKGTKKLAQQQLGELLSIIQTVNRPLHQGIIIEPTKTESSRPSVDLDDDTIDVLRGHIGKQMLTRLELEGAYEDHGLVFPGSLRKPLNTMTVTRAFQS